MLSYSPGLESTLGYSSIQSTVSVRISVRPGSDWGGSWSYSVTGNRMTIRQISAPMTLWTLLSKGKNQGWFPGENTFLVRFWRRNLKPWGTREGLNTVECNGRKSPQMMVSPGQGPAHRQTPGLPSHLLSPLGKADSLLACQGALLHTFLAPSTPGLWVCTQGCQGRGWRRAGVTQPGNREWPWKQCESSTYPPATPRLAMGRVVTEGARALGRELQGAHSAQSHLLQEALPGGHPDVAAAAGQGPFHCSVALFTTAFSTHLSSVFSNESLGKARLFLSSCILSAPVSSLWPPWGYGLYPLVKGLPKESPPVRRWLCGKALLLTWEGRFLRKCLHLHMETLLPSVCCCCCCCCCC